jgi:hypothetical protein
MSSWYGWLTEALDAYGTNVVENCMRLRDETGELFMALLAID